MINLRIICSIYLTFNLLTVNAQAIDSLFINQPDTYNPILSKKNRIELLHFYKSNKKDSTINRFGNKSIVLRYDSLNKLIKIKNTSVSQFEMKQIAIKGIEAICVIKTINKPISNSSIAFFTKNWDELSVSFTYPKSKDWLISEQLNNSTIDSNWLYNTLNINFISLSFSEKDNTIIATNNLIDFLSIEDKLTIEPFINKDPLIYKYINQFWEK